MGQYETLASVNVRCWWIRRVVSDWLSRYDKYIPIDERRWRGVTQLKTRPDDPLLNGHHPRASRTLMHSGCSYHLIAMVLRLRRADRHPVTAWLDHRVRYHHCSSRKFSPFRRMERASLRWPTHRVTFLVQFMLTRFADSLPQHSLLNWRCRRNHVREDTFSIQRT
jgi:hypothetical protein